MAKKNEGDSGKFGDLPTAREITRLAGIAKARSVGGKALAVGKPAMPKVKPVQGDTLQSGKIDNAGGINQGMLSGQRGLRVRRTSDGYMKKK